MADVIKFRCKACEKKISVRAEYAGKKAKCPGCKNPLRVPSPRPKRSSTGVPIAAGTGDSNSSGAGEKSYSLADLAEMEANANAEIKELSHKAANRPNSIRIEGGKDCPGCGSSCKPDAVICVHCGHNFDSGKKLKTKKDSKVGKAFASVKDAAASESDGGGGGLANGLNNLWTLCAGAFFCVLGIGAIFYDWDLSENDSGKGRIISDLFNALGPVPTGLILIGVGLFLFLFGFTRSGD